jgi:tetratricopeptide (TPR) repeat protein
MADHIFISYKHSDALYARVLMNELEKAGFEYWWDENIPLGGNWSDTIDTSIREALAVIVLMSPEAQKSEYVTYEWSFALGARVPLLPIIIQKVENLHPRLKPLQYEDLSASSNPHFDEVIAWLKTLRDQRAANAQPQRVIAPESEVILQMERARAKYDEQNYARAVEIYTSALSNASDRLKPEVSTQMAYVLCKLGDLTRAEPALAEALTLRPDFNDALAARGYLHSLQARRTDDSAQQRQHFRDAAYHLETALANEHNLRDMDNESWWAALGGVYRRNGEYTKAIAAYEEAIKVTPQSTYPRSNLALVFLMDKQQGKLKRSYAIIKRIARSKVEKDIFDFWANADLVLAELALGQYDEAQTHLDEFLEILPEDGSVNILSSLRDSLKLLAGVVEAQEAPNVQRFSDQLEAFIAKVE